jgi:DNA-binding NtrC family response regulator
MSLGKIVAIIDDEEDITTLFYDTLKAIDGITVFTFTDPISALKHFQENKDCYVLVITDYRMPGLKGPELLSKMKRANKNLRTILMTAFDVENATFSDYTKRKIIHAFFQKPVRLTQLIEVLHTELHSYVMQKRVSTER